METGGARQRKEGWRYVDEGGHVDVGLEEVLFSREKGRKKENVH